MSVSLLDSIATPTLLLDETRARANLARMAQKARAAELHFRPHFKTHQSAAIGEWFRAHGVTAITVSSVSMARYFADAGWEDITIAFPVNLRELPAINELASRARIGLLVDAAASLHALAAGAQHAMDIWLEVDTGYGRSGIPVEARARFAQLLDSARAQPLLTVRGLLTHSGHSYATVGGQGLGELYAQTVDALQGLRADLAAQGYPQLLTSLGDTPTSSVVENLGGIDEMRPGNFIFYDWMQHRIGSCAEAEIAVAVACPVVANYPERHEVILYGGAVHLSKEFIARADGTPDYGHVAALTAQGWGDAWQDVWLRSLSQEHGIVRATPAAYARHLATLQPGDLVAVLPIHSCLTANLLKRYTTLDGEVLEMMRW